MKKKTLLTGVKPTGRPHIGNYFGAMKQMVSLQADYETFVFVANLHALTTTHDPSALLNDTKEIVFDYLAIGLDPTQTAFYLQSDIPEVTELAWYFNCITTVPYLMRAHAYKDAAAKNKEVSVGTFDYPLLMAADILMQDADVIPVGQDQKQHIEIARDTAEKFNRLFGDTFALPIALILDELKTVPGHDGKKMSKSYGNTLSLFASDEEIRGFVMKIVTDSKTQDEPKDPEACNIFALHKLVSEDMLPEVARRYRDGGMGYKESKEILIHNLIRFITPLRKKREEVVDDPAKAVAPLAKGKEKARARAARKIKRVRAAVGVESF